MAASAFMCETNAAKCSRPGAREGRGLVPRDESSVPLRLRPSMLWTLLTETV